MRSFIKLSLSLILSLSVSCLCMVSAFAADEIDDFIPVLVHRVDYQSEPFTRMRTAYLVPDWQDDQRCIVSTSEIGLHFLAVDPQDSTVWTTGGRRLLYSVNSGLYQLTFSYRGSIRVYAAARDVSSPVLGSLIYNGVSSDLQFVSITYSVPDGQSYLNVGFVTYYGDEFDLGEYNIRFLESDPNASFLSSLHSVVFSVLNTISHIGSTIVNEPILLLTCGILVLGASVAILGRCMRRE